MADTTTTTYSLVKPEIGASTDSWGLKWNNNLDSIDNLLNGTTAIAPNLTAGSWKISGTAITATAAQVNFLTGVTSAIQTQLGAKASSGANSDITSLTGLTTPLSTAKGGTGLNAIGSAAQVLTVNSAGNALEFAAVPISAITDGSISTAKIADSAATSDKIADDAVTSNKIADDAVTLSKMAGLARGKVIVGDASGNPSALTAGTAGQILISNGTDIAYANPVPRAFANRVDASSLSANSTQTILVQNLDTVNQIVMINVVVSHSSSGVYSTHVLRYRLSTDNGSNWGSYINITSSNGASGPHTATANLVIDMSSANAIEFNQYWLNGGSGASGTASWTEIRL